MANSKVKRCSRDEGLGGADIVLEQVEKFLYKDVDIEAEGPWRQR